jgi:hypothetical protein
MIDMLNETGVYIELLDIFAESSIGEGLSIYDLLSVYPDTAEAFA